MDHYRNEILIHSRFLEDLFNCCNKTKNATETEVPNKVAKFKTQCQH